MALLDFLNRKKEIEKAKKKSDKKEKKAEKISDTAKKSDKVTTVKKEEKVNTVKSKEIKGFSYEVVDGPHISEKASILSEQNKYVFKIIGNRANKHEIKKSVEGIYGVDVLAVNMIKVPPKKRRIGRTQGFKKGYSKAVVTIKEGQQIEIL